MPEMYSGQLRFEDYLNAARDKEQGKKNPQPVRRIYSLSSKQISALKEKYINAVPDEFTTIIDGDFVYCENRIVTGFTSELAETGVITREEAELAAGKRHLPLGRTKKINAPLSIDGLYESGAWLELLYAQNRFKGLTDYFYAQIKKTNDLRVYNSDPSAAIRKNGEYFSFDPSSLKECLDALNKTRGLAENIFK